MQDKKSFYETEPDEKLPVAVQVETIIIPVEAEEISEYIEYLHIENDNVEDRLEYLRRKKMYICKALGVTMCVFLSVIVAVASSYKT